VFKYFLQNACDLLGLALLSASAVAYSISISYPLASQYPPIARVGHPFSWTISPTTFTLDDGVGSSSQQLTYAAGGLPEWLNFDTSTRSFTGAPPLSAVNSPATVIVTVSTIDSSVSSTDSFTLVTLNSQPPYINHPIYAQLTDPANTALSGAFRLHPNSALPPPASVGSSVPGLRLPPSWSFSIGIRGDTFLSPSGRSLFYSSSPLPPWVTFNPWTYTFDGVTPSTSGEQVEIVVRGSERKGYSDPSAEEHFWISIASEELHLSGPASSNGSLTANVTAGEAFEISLHKFIENGSLWDGGKEQKLGSVSVVGLLNTQHVGDEKLISHVTRIYHLIHGSSTTLHR
jgi:axial budding pattern protein 2